MSFLLQLRALFTKKFTIILVSTLTSITLLQGLRLHQYMGIYEVRGNIIDFILFTIGGWESPNLFTFLLTWFCLNFIFLYASVRSRIVIENFSEFLTTRHRNRVCTWLSNCVTQFIIALILFIMYFFIVVGVGMIIFDGKIEISAYTQEFYSNWVSLLNVGVLKMAGIVFAIFVSGLYAIFIVSQVALLICRNTMQAIMSLAGIMLIGAISFIYMGLPRIFAIVLYTSTTSLAVVSSDVLQAILINIMIGVLSTILGGVYIRKIDMCY